MYNEIKSYKDSKNPTLKEIQTTCVRLRCYYPSITEFSHMLPQIPLFPEDTILYLIHTWNIPHLLQLWFYKCMTRYTNKPTYLGFCPNTQLAYIDDFMYTLAFICIPWNTIDTNVLTDSHRINFVITNMTLFGSVLDLFISCQLSQSLRIPPVKKWAVEEITELKLGLILQIPFINQRSITLASVEPGKGLDCAILAVAQVHYESQLKKTLKSDVEF